MDKNRKKSPAQITLIGASQSGKTTLAAGLVKSNDQKFTVGFGDDATRAYLEPRIAGIEGGHWPEASVGENLDLALNINTTGGQTAAISFKEYMGEKFSDTTYIERVVGDPNAALILLSPGMDILHNAEGRTEMINKMKVVIDHLKAVHCTAVARVVTASDRLVTDLRDFAPKFKECLSEIDNYLTTSGVQWKPFEVTITGRLTNQNSPYFAIGKDNTAREPFVWLMGRIKKETSLEKFKKTVKRMTVCSAVLGAAAVITCSSMFIYERNVLGKFKTAAESAIAKFDAADKARQDKESGMKGAVDDLGIVIQDAEKTRFWFASIRSDRGRQVEAWKKAYDEKSAKYLQFKIDKLKEESVEKGTEEDCSNLEKLLGKFKPNDAALKTKLEEAWKKAKPVISENIDGRKHKELAGKIGEMIKAAEHSQEDVDRLNEGIEGWAPLTDKGSAQKKQLQEQFLAHLPAWKQEIADRKCGEDADKAASSLGQDPQPGPDGIRDNLEKALNFAKMHTNASPRVLQVAVTKLSGAQAAFFEKFQARFSRDWASSSKKRPALSDEDARFITTALDVDVPATGKKVSERFLEELRKKCEKAGADWDAARESEVDAFIRDTFPQACSAVVAFDSYCKWYEHHADNPYIAKVDAKALESVAGFFDGYVAEVQREFLEDNSAFTSEVGRQKAGRRFGDFQKLCIKLSKDSGGLANSWCAAFARDCVNAGEISRGMNKAFAQYLDITRIDVKVSEDGKYDDYLGGKFAVSLSRSELEGLQFKEASSDALLSIDDYDGYAVNKQDAYHTIWPKSGTENETQKTFLNPWTFSGLEFLATLDVSGTVYDAKTYNNGKEGSVFLRLNPAEADYRNGSVEMTCKCKYKEQYYTCSIRVVCKFSGPDIFEMYKRHRQGR